MSNAPDPRGEIFVKPEAFADMDAWHATAAELREESPVLRVEVEGWQPFWAVTRHADVFDVSESCHVIVGRVADAAGSMPRCTVLAHRT